VQHHPYFVADNTCPTVAIKCLPLSCACRCMDQSNSAFIGESGLSGTFSPQLHLPLRASSPPSNTLLLEPNPLNTPNGILIGSAIIGPKCYAVKCIVNGEENLQKLPFPLGFRHPAGEVLSHDHRQHVQQIWERSCMVPEISLWTDRQAQRHTYSLQYFANAPAGEVMS